MPLALPLSIDDLELAWLKEDFAEGWGKNGVAITSRNLLRQPYFDSASVYTGTWAGTGGATTTSQLTANDIPGQPNNTPFRRLTWTTAPTTTGGIYAGNGSVLANSMDFVAGKYYFTGVWTRNSIARNIRLSYEPRDNTNTVLSGSGLSPLGGTPVNANTWTWLTNVCQAPATSVKTLVGVYNIGGANRLLGEESDVTCMIHAEVKSLTDVLSFFSGSTANDAIYSYAWEGPVNLSTSIRTANNPIQYFGRGTVGDLEWSYWAKRSSLFPNEQWSFADHKMNALKTLVGAPIGNTIGEYWISYMQQVTGLVMGPGLSGVDLEMAFYKAQLGL